MGWDLWNLDEMLWPPEKSISPNKINYNTISFIKMKYSPHKKPTVYPEDI